jgi:CO/xanthine dehydrogenase Mo-binding subunit
MADDRPSPARRSPWRRRVDIPDVDVVFVGERDPTNPGDAKGIGEGRLVGIVAEIANGIYGATGRRIGSLQITISQLL